MAPNVRQMSNDRRRLYRTENAWSAPVADRGEAMYMRSQN